MKKIYSVLGLMSGTSLDGVDVAWIETDGDGVVIPRGFHTVPYTQDVRDSIRAVLGVTQRNDNVEKARRALTMAHAQAISEFFDLYHINSSTIDLIGFHGQTITHAPHEGFTWQIGDAQFLADQFSCPVVADFRVSDVKAGGEGAPLLPLYHHARMRVAAISEPVAVVNIGGVSNITFLHGDDIAAFDCGPGNALMDDEMFKRRQKTHDADGALARTGTADFSMIASWLAHPYFKKSFPKSLDRNAWDVSLLQDFSDENALATLTHFTAQTIARGCHLCPTQPTRLFVTGGGRHNHYVMELIEKYTHARTEKVESLGWNGDALEAEGFAYLAVRSVLNLPLSLPTTTGVKHPQTGGVLFHPKNHAA